MTKPKLNPAKRGRKPKDLGEKLQQLTIRLTPTTRLGLELLARERSVSVSEVAEQLVSQRLQSEPVAGTSVYDLISALGKADFALPSQPSNIRERVAESLIATPPFLVMSLPPALRRPHERLFASVYERLGPKTPDNAELMLDPDVPRQLLDACLIAHRQGVDAEALVTEWAPAFEVQSTP